MHRVRGGFSPLPEELDLLPLPEELAFSHSAECTVCAIEMLASSALATRASMKASGQPHINAY